MKTAVLVSFVPTSSSSPARGILEDLGLELWKQWHLQEEYSSSKSLVQAARAIIDLRGGRHHTTLPGGTDGHRQNTDQTPKRWWANVWDHPTPSNQQTKLAHCEMEGPSSFVQSHGVEVGPQRHGYCHSITPRATTMASRVLPTRLQVRSGTVDLAGEKKRGLNSAADVV